MRTEDGRVTYSPAKWHLAAGDALPSPLAGNNSPVHLTERLPPPWESLATFLRKGVRGAARLVRAIGVLPWR